MPLHYAHTCSYEILKNLTMGFAPIKNSLVAGAAPAKKVFGKTAQQINRSLWDFMRAVSPLAGVSCHHTHSIAVPPLSRQAYPAL